MSMVLLGAAWGGEGDLRVEVTNIIQQEWPAKIELLPQGSTEVRTLRVPEGTGVFPTPAGQYKALIYVYDWDVPVMVDVQEVFVESGIMTNLTYEVVEGRLGQVRLREFDTDGDLVLDRVEVDAGTDPADPASYPGAVPVPWTSKVLEDGKPRVKWTTADDKYEGQWYAGDLHVRSRYGGGQESVADLVKRAESAGLDFIAITDRHSVEAIKDPGFDSDKVVLIPAMEWGNEEHGVALVYGMRTMPPASQSISEAQAFCYRTQAQGGIFAIAHPCFPKHPADGTGTSPWQWGTSYVNAIEVWCRSDWRQIPPTPLDQFVSEYQRRQDGKLVYSISRAATASTLSANGQAAMFWDYELVRGLRASPIAGSLSSDPNVPLGRPVTWIYAREKSVAGILEGLRLGRTFVSASKDGPMIRFLADEGKNATYDVNIGGIIPLNKETEFTIQAIGAQGARLELLENGRVVHSHHIEAKKVETLARTVQPTSYTVYRARIVQTPEEQGFGPHEMLAMSGPIYAQRIVPIQAGLRFQIAELLYEKELSLEALAAATGQDEERLVFHLQQLDQLDLLLARNEGTDRFFRLNRGVYEYLDKSLLSVDDLWAPLQMQSAGRVSASTMTDRDGRVWVQPSDDSRTTPFGESDWIEPQEFETLQPKNFSPEN
jgi:DNA-binding transcriptional ArsR family regulator